MIEYQNLFSLIQVDVQQNIEQEKFEYLNLFIKR